VLLLLQAVSDENSSTQRRYTKHVNECLHQLSESNSSAAVCTEDAIVALLYILKDEFVATMSSRSGNQYSCRQSSSAQ
jgi:hypothetical protein